MSRRGTYITIPLVNAEFNNFSLGSLASGTSSESHERGFVELDLTVQAFGLVKQVLVDAQAAESVEALNRLLIDLDMETEPKGLNAEAEVLKQGGFGLPGEPAGLPPRAGWFEPMTTCDSL